MPLFQRDDKIDLEKFFLEKAFQHRADSQYSTLTLRLNGTECKIHTLVFFFAFPWLKIDQDEDSFLTIADTQIDPKCFVVLENLLHFGEAICRDKELLDNAQSLCNCFGMSLSSEEIIARPEDHADGNLLDKEVTFQHIVCKELKLKAISLLTYISGKVSL